jgi:hypothetical protein
MFSFPAFYCFSQKKADTIKLNRAYLISMTTQRMYISKYGTQDVYKTVVTFRKTDSSIFTIIFRGQKPLPVKFSSTEENILPIVDGIKCYLQLHHYYDLEFYKICKDKITGYSYYSYFVDFDINDCSHIIVPFNSKRLKKGYKIQLMHPYMEVSNYLYRMDVFNCSTKFPPG